jgi:hypothetical protein
MNFSNAYNWYYDDSLKAFIPENTSNLGYDVLGHKLEGGTRTKYNDHVLSGSLDDVNTVSLDFGYNVTVLLTGNDNVMITGNDNISIN